MGGGPGAAGRRLLVVEDDERVVAVWAAALADEGYEVRTQGSALGVAGLLRDWCPDAVLLDLGLPYRSGAALLVDLKTDPTTEAVPVVIVSAAPDTLPPEYRGLVAAVLPKPFDLAHALAVLAALWPPSPPPP
jgi:DNA-binding response OmpR family regulator